MDEIKESRLVPIKDKIITLKDLKKLADLVYAEYEPIKESSRYASVEFSAHCSDNSVFSSESPSIFSEESRLLSKRVTSINISMTAYVPESSIEIHLNHGDSYFYNRNQIIVNGNDSKWVNGTLRNLEEIIEGFTPQNVFVRKYRKIIQTIFALSLGSVIGWILVFIIRLVPPSPDPTSGINYLLIEFAKNYLIARYLIVYALFWCIGIMPASNLIDKLESLWPIIEFQIGPEHTFIEKRRRQWLISAFLLGILPLIINLVYDILKGLLLVN